MGSMATVYNVGELMRDWRKLSAAQFREQRDFETLVVGFCRGDAGSFKTKETVATVTLSDALKWLGDHRDGFLVGGAVLYGLGYLVWSCNAWLNDLGQIPAFEFQYVTSGIIPVAIVALAWAGLVVFRTVSAKIEKSALLKWLIPIAILIAMIFIFHYLVPPAGKGWTRPGWTKQLVSLYLVSSSLIVYFLS